MGDFGGGGGVLMLINADADIYVIFCAGSGEAYFAVFVAEMDDDNSNNSSSRWGETMMEKQETRVRGSSTVEIPAAR